MKTIESAESQRVPSFRERSAWVCFCVTIVFFVPYFAVAYRRLMQDQLTADWAIGGFVGAVIFQVVVLILAHIIIAIRCKDEPMDERDLAIESLALRKAYSALSYSCLPAIVCILVLAAAPSPRPWEQFVSPAFISQVVLLCFVAAEATNQLAQAMAYRKAA